MVVSGRVNPFECTQSHPTKKNTASVSLHLKKSTQLMAQIMVFCFFFGKISGQQFFQLTIFPRFFFLMAKTCWWPTTKNIKVHPQQHNSTFSFCKIAMLLLLFTPTLHMFSFFGPRFDFDEKKSHGFVVSPPVQRCGQRQGNHRYIAGTWRCKLQPNGRSESESHKNIHGLVGWLVGWLLRCWLLLEF